MAALLGKYDFSSPFMKAAIITNIGQTGEERFPLWFDGGGTQKGPQLGTKLNGYSASGAAADPLYVSSLAYVSSVSVELGLGYIPQLTASLTPPFDEARKFLDSTLIEWATSVLEIQFGYATGENGPIISPPFQGLIKQPDVQYGSDITIGLTAQGTAGYYLNSTGAAGNYVKQKRSDIIDSFAAKLKVKRGTDVLDTNALILLGEEESYSTATQSFLSVIYDIARRCGCYLDLSNDQLRLVSMSKLVLGEVVATLALYDYKDGKLGPAAGGVYPILSASTDHKGIYLGPAAKSSLRVAVDKLAKEKQEAKAEPEDVTATGKKDVGVKTEQAAESKTVQPSEGESALDSVQKEAVAAIQAESFTNGMGVQLEIETLGFPDILPAQLVTVTGLGKRIDGNFVVFKVKHNLSSSGYTTSLTVVQNSSMMTQQLKKANPAIVFNTSAEVAAQPQSSAVDPAPQRVPVQLEVQQGAA